MNNKSNSPFHVFNEVVNTIPVCPIGEALKVITESDNDGRIVPMVSVSAKKINDDGTESYGVVSMSKKRYEKLMEMSGKSPIIHQTPVSFGKTNFIMQLLNDKKNTH